MPYPDTTRDPDTHFDLVLEAFEDKLRHYQNEIDEEGIAMYYEIDHYTKDYLENTDKTTYYATGWVEYHIKDMGDVINKASMAFWKGEGELDHEYIFSSIDTDMPLDGIDGQLLIKNKTLTFEADYYGYTQENDFDVFLEVCPEDSKMYKIIYDMQQPAEVYVYNVDYDIGDYAEYNDLRGAIRAVFKMVTELYESGELGDLYDIELFAEDYSEDIILAYSRGEFTDKEYISNLYKVWNS